GAPPVLRSAAAAARPSNGGSPKGGFPERGLRGEMAAEPVDTAAWRCRGRAEVEATDWWCVRHRAQARAGKQLSQRVRASADVATHEVRVVAFQICCRPCRDSEYSLAETRSEPLDLRVDPRSHVGDRAVRDVAIGPGGMSTRWGPRLVEHALL